MKKGLVFVLILTCIFSFMGCSKNENGHIEGKALTMEKVRELAEKGEELTWSDFEDYPYEDIGSGLYIYRYEIDESYYLLIGGVPEIPLCI